MTKKKKQAASHERERQKRLDAQKKRAAAPKKTAAAPRPKMSIKETAKRLQQAKGQKFIPHGDPKLFSKIDTPIQESIRTDFGEDIVGEVVSAIVFAVDRYEKVSDDLEDFIRVIDSGGYGGFSLIHTTAVQVHREHVVRSIILNTPVILTSLNGHQYIIDPKQTYEDNKKDSDYLDHMTSLLDALPQQAMSESANIQLVNDDKRFYTNNTWVKI